MDNKNRSYLENLYVCADNFKNMCTNIAELSFVKLNGHFVKILTKKSKDFGFATPKSRTQLLHSCHFAVSDKFQKLKMSTWSL